MAGQLTSAAPAAVEFKKAKRGLADTGCTALRWVSAAGLEGLEMTAGEVPPDKQPLTLWLQVQHEDSSWTFELSPDEERAIVVGSLLRANVRIERDHVAPVHFHFEREGDRVKLIPAYNNDLRVNSERVQHARFLEPWSIIEFARTRVDVKVAKWPRSVQVGASACPAEGLVDAANESDSSLDSLQWKTSPERETMAFAPLYDVHLRAGGIPTAWIAPSSGTTDTDADHKHDAHPLPQATEVASDPVLRLWFSDDPTPVVHGSVPKVRSGDAPGSSKIESDSGGAKVSIRSVAGSLLVQLGIATRERPLLVLLAACGGSIIIGLTLLALSRIWAVASNAPDTRLQAPVGSSSASSEAVEEKEHGNE